MKLKLVNPEEAAMPRVYIAGPPENLTDYTKAAAALAIKGFSIANNYEDVHPSQNNEKLRRAIATLVTCNAICVLEDWWTSVEAHCLLQVAGWLRMPVVDAQAQKVETISAEGPRR